MELPYTAITQARLWYSMALGRKHHQRHPEEIFLFLNMSPRTDLPLNVFVFFFFGGGNANEGMKQLFSWKKPHFAVYFWICDPAALKRPLRPHGSTYFMLPFVAFATL